MHMLLVADVFVVEAVDADILFAVSGTEEGDEIALEVCAKILYVLLGILADNLQLSDVRLRLDVALEAVGIAALLLADFTPPSKSLEAFGLHLVRQVLRASKLGFRHSGDCARATLRFRVVGFGGLVSDAAMCVVILFERGVYVRSVSLQVNVVDWSGVGMKCGWVGPAAYVRAKTFCHP
jgi:hypothetical protein